MRFINKGRQLLFLMLFLMLALTVTSGTAEASGTTQNMVSYAKKNKVTKGKWVKSKKGIRYRKKNGTYIKNEWCYISGAIYCFDENGYVVTKSFKYNSDCYYADTKGRIYVNKWRKVGKKSYYYGSNGVRLKGCWHTIKGKTYYFDRSGELVTNSWVGNSYVNKNGVKVASKTVKGRTINKTGSVQKASKKDKYIIIGASRIVDMSIAANSSNTIFIAKSGEGYRWLKSTAGPQLAAYLKKNPDYKVIFQLGNNDMQNILSYISYYAALIKKYPKTQFYFLDATPGDGKGAKKNAARQKFNEKMRAVFGNRCIGGYDYMYSIKFTTVDGVHYPQSVSKKLYNYAIQAADRAKVVSVPVLSGDGLIEE